MSKPISPLDNLDIQNQLSIMPEDLAGLRVTNIKIDEGQLELFLIFENDHVLHIGAFSTGGWLKLLNVSNGSVVSMPKWRKFSISDN